LALPENFRWFICNVDLMISGTLNQCSGSLGKQSVVIYKKNLQATPPYNNEGKRILFLQARILDE
jgi:hypothetical protein